jgi:glycosyltransferase involved in cell wall biosynthesis
MRVLHVMRGSEEIYGAERVVLAELAKLRALGIDAKLLLLHELRHGAAADTLAVAAEERGIPVIRVPAHSQLSLQMLQAVRRAIVAESPALLHCHGYKGDFIGLAAGRLARLPLVGEISGWLFPTSNARIRLYEWIDAQALKRMERAVVLSDYYRRMCLRMGFDAARLRLIPSGLDLPRLRAAAGKVDIRARLGLEPGTPTVGMLTRLSREKGVDLFLQAMAFVVRRIPRAKGIIFGTGPELARLQELAAGLGVTNSVIWAGYCSEAMDALRALDVLAMTSRIEALPQTLMEAMVMARPAVVTPVGGCPELVADGETGFVAPSLDPEVIASRVCHLLERPELARAMGERGAARIEAGYTMDHWAERTIELYEEVARG